MGRTLRLTGRTIDLDTGAIAEGGCLRPMELVLLCYLAEHAGRVISREELLTEVWGYSDLSRSNTVNTTWYRLRRAVDGDPPQHLFSLPGRGVRLSGIEVPILRTSNVRPVGDELIGRADELAFLRDCPARLITITGPGGAGKTRLAVEHARQSRPSGGSWLAEVARAPSEAVIVERVAAALGLGPVDPARFGAALAHRGPTLVVLDEAEDAVGPVSACARAWIAEAPELRLVVTSRVPLGVPGEQRLPLQPLALPTVLEGPAAELFLARIRAADPGFRVDGQEEALRQVLGQVDGLPLAIELAAPHVAALGAEAVRAALHAGDPLESRGDDRPERQRSLHTMVAWSWAALPESARGTVRQLLAFRGSFALEAASAVVRSVGDLTLLREHGLVVPVRAGGPRFRVLETLRAVAGDPDPDAVLRHVAWYVALTQRRMAALHGLLPLDTADEEEAEELLHAATAMLDRSDEPGVAELFGYALTSAGRTRRSDARALVDAALQRPVAARARVRIGRFVASAQDWDPSGALFRTVPDEAMAVGLTEVALEVELSRFLRRFIAGDEKEAHAAKARIAMFVREIPSSSPLTDWADGIWAYVDGMVGEGPGLPRLEYAVGRMIDPSDRARIQGEIAQMYDALKRTDDSVRASEAALRDLTRPSWLRAHLLAELAVPLARLGRTAEADGRLEEAFAIARHLSTSIGMSMLQMWHAEVLRLGGRLEEAEEVASAAMVRARDQGERNYEAHARATHALIRADRGAADAAARVRDAFEECFQLVRARQMMALLGAMADLGSEPDLLDRIERTLGLPDMDVVAPRLVLIRAECLRDRGEALAAVPRLAEVADHQAVEPLRLRLRLALAAIAAEHGDDRSARELCNVPWAPADGRWTRVHRARCLAALGRREAALREIAPVRCTARERVLQEAIAEITIGPDS